MDSLFMALGFLGGVSSSALSLWWSIDTTDTKEKAIARCYGLLLLWIILFTGLLAGLAVGHFLI